MSFLDTLAKTLGFNNTPVVAPAKPVVTPVYPTPDGKPIQTSSFISTLAKNIGASTVPVPTINNLPKTTISPTIAANSQSLVDLTKATVRALPRVIAGSANSIVQSSMGQEQSPYQPTGAVQKFVLGSEPIKSVTQQYEEEVANYTPEKTGLPKKYNTPLIIASIAGGAAGEALPAFGGAEENVARKLFKDGFDDLIKSGVAAKTEAEAYHLLRDAGINHEIATAKAPVLAAAKDAKAAKLAIQDTAAEQSQIVQKTAQNRLEELNKKADGYEVPNPETKIPDKVQGQILTHDELNERNFLKQNANKPSELMNAYVDDTPRPKQFSPEAVAEKERRYISSAQHSDDIANELIGDISESYSPKTNKALSERAIARVNEDYQAAKKFSLEEGTDEAVATRVAIDKQLSLQYRKAATAAEKDIIAKELRQSIIEHSRLATEEGRAVQANALLGKTTPEGMLRTTSRMIDDFNKTAEVKGFKKRPQINEDDVKYVIEESKRIEDLPKGTSQDIAKKRLNERLESLIPTPAWKKVITVWKAGLLTGIKTSGVNTMSNFFHGVAENVKNLPATGIDLATSFFTGERTKALNLKGLFQGSKEGVKKGWEYLKTGIEPEAGGSALEFNKVHFDSKPGKALQAYADTVYKVLGAEDMPFFYGALRRSLGEQALVAIKNGKMVFKDAAERTKFIQDFIDNPPKNALELADMDAKVATFRNDTTLGKAANAVQNAHPAVQAILPFAKTPSAVATALYNYTPAGALDTLYRNFIKGPFNQKDFAEGLGRAATGTGALWLGSKLYKDGRISLEYPADEKERAKWEATGKTPNSILIDGKWVPLVSFGPAGSVLGIGGYISKGYQETGSVAGGAISGLTGGVKGLTEQTFLTGVKNLIDAINEPEKKGTALAGGLLASVVPTIISDFNTAFDDYQRKSSGTLLGPLKARIPGVREELPKKLDVWGQPLERNRNAVATAISPIRLSNTIQGPLNTEVERLGQLGEDIRPTKIDKKIKNFTLNEDEYYKYQRLYGNLLTKTLTALIKNPGYQSKTPEQQTKLWKDATVQVREAVQDVIAPELIKRRFDLKEGEDPKVYLEYLNALSKKSPEFVRASPEKQKKVIEKLISKSST